MNPTRFKVLIGVAVVLLAMLIWNWIAGWGLVTVHATDKPLATIIQSIERQGGIKIVTNADPTTAITLDVDRVPVVEAVDVLATRMDGNWSVGYVAGAQKSDVINGIALLQQGERRNADYAQFGGGGFGGGGPGGGMDVGDATVDVRRVAWKVSPSDKPELQSYLEQFTAKTGAMVMTPRAWNPTLTAPPKGGKVASAIREMIKSAKGEVEEVFVIRVRTEDPNRTANAGGGDQGGGGGRPDGGFGNRPDGGGRGNFNPEWMQERVEARIATLPSDQQAQARKDFQEMRTEWERIRALPDTERRAAMEQMFNNPAVQERMVQRQMSGDAKRSPEQRADRFRQYIQRKQQAKEAKAQAQPAG